MIRLGVVLFLVSLVMWLWALFDSIATDSNKVRNLPKFVWIVLILVSIEIGAVGAIAWFMLGRPRQQPLLGGPGERAAGPRPPGPRPPGSRPSGSRPSRPVGPDDDPDFLRGI